MSDKEPKFSFEEISKFGQSKYILTEDRFMGLFVERKGVDISDAREYYKAFQAFPFSVYNKEQSEYLKLILPDIVEYLDERDKMGIVRTVGTYEKKHLIRLYYREHDSGENDPVKEIDLDLYESNDVMTYADIIKRSECLFILEKVDSHYIADPKKGKTRDLIFYEGDIYHAKDNYWGNKKGNVYVAEKDGFKRLLYTKGVGYVDGKGRPNYDEEGGKYSSYVVAGYDFIKMGNIHLNDAVLKD